jgi:hypothetical protein
MGFAVDFREEDFTEDMCRDAFLIDWTSDRPSQGYTDLQSLQYAVRQGCVRLRNALKCISQAIFTVTDSRVAD